MTWRLQPSDKQVIQQEVDNERLLIERSRDGDAEGVKELLTKDNVRVNAEAFNMSLYYKSKNYWTPLHHAASKGHTEVVEVLIEHGADLDARDMVDMTPVHLAAENGHVECLRRLLEAGASCNIGTAAKKPQWVTTTVYKHAPNTLPLHLAALNNHIPCILELMVNGADYNIIMINPFNPRIWHKTVKTFIYKHAPNTLPLHLAALNNHIPCILELMVNGADYNAVDGEGKTALYISAEGGHEEAILTQLQNAYGKTILSLPARPTDDTALHHCINHSLVEAVRELLIHGSDVNHRNNVGQSPLHLALFNNTEHAPAIASAILNLGYNLDINVRDMSGLTPLEYVCFRTNTARRDRRPALAALLIAHGANFHGIKSVRGQSLLHQELSYRVSDSIILRAIVDSMLKLPSMTALGLIMPRRRMPWELNLARGDDPPRRQQHITDRLPGGARVLRFDRGGVRVVELEVGEGDDGEQLRRLQVLLLYNHRYGADLRLGSNRIYRSREQDMAERVLIRARLAQRGGRARAGSVGNLLEQGGELEQQEGWGGLREEEVVWRGEEEWKEYMERCQWYADMAASPRSLQQHCRVLIRKCLGPLRLRYVGHLPLPVSLQRFLLLDVDDPGLKTFIHENMKQGST